METSQKPSSSSKSIKKFFRILLVPPKRVEDAAFQPKEGTKKPHRPRFGGTGIF